jgi:mono/diheme cytochrome c family protein
MVSTRTFRFPLPLRTAGVAMLAFALAGVVPGAAAQPASQRLVERGEYLARAGDCISCHTAQGGAAYAGGLRMDTPFGALVAPNITPDIDTGIGAWSADEFYRAMHEGINKRGQDLYPAMPYTFFTKVTREDCNAIYAYLRTIKPVRNAVDINQLRWPFDIRSTMATWRALYFTAGTFKAEPLQTAAWNRGAYLIEGLGHCSACHSPRNALGAIEKNKAFTGATVDGWFALNLTENLNTGLGEWQPAQIVAYLKAGAAKAQSTALGPMAEVVHNSLSHLTDADLGAMAVYLKSLPPNSALRTPYGEADPTKERGAALYTDHCSGCHQAKGGGIPGVFPPLASNDAVIAPDPADVLKVVLEGIPARNTYIAMPSFAGQLTDREIADIANYVRTRWGNVAAPDATQAMVAKLRGSRE